MLDTSIIDHHCLHDERSQTIFSHSNHYWSSLSSFSPISSHLTGWWARFQLKLCFSVRLPSLPIAPWAPPHCERADGDDRCQQTDIFMYILVHLDFENCTTILWSEMCNEYYSYFSNAETIDFFSLIGFYCEHGAFYLSILAFFAVSQPNSDHKSTAIEFQIFFGRIAGNATLFDYFWMHVHHSSLSSSNFLLC